MGDPFTSWEDGLPDDDSGCRYVLDGNQACGAAEKPGSSYCPKHHARCYLTPAQEREKEREIEALARAVGGRFAARRALSARELRRIEKAGTLQQTRIG
jgi:hypothetical protein